MDNLRLVIGSAPSEMSEEELLRKITLRQGLIGAELAAFREKITGPVVKKKTALRVVGKAESSGNVTEFMEELKKLGMSMEEFKEQLKRREGVH